MRSILHVDGDNFFAACLMAAHPHYKGKPIVVGKERGMAVALSGEAKKLGITRGMPIFQIQKSHKEAIILDGDYALFSRISRSLYTIIQRYTTIVEHYSIDECFADISHYCEKTGRKSKDVAKEIQQVIFTELDIAVSVGVASTKTLAKLYSTKSKPFGFAEETTREEREETLSKTPVDRVWGIGKATARRLRVFGIETALELTKKHLPTPFFSKPTRIIQEELKGNQFLFFKREAPLLKSMLSSHSFPKTSDPIHIADELRKHLSSLSLRLQGNNLYTKKITLFVKESSGIIHSDQLSLIKETNDLPHILDDTEKIIEQLSNIRVPIKTTGAIASFILPTHSLQESLFRDLKDPATPFQKTIAELAEKGLAIRPAVYFSQKTT